MNLFYLFSFKLDIQDSLGENVLLLLLFIVILNVIVFIRNRYIYRDNNRCGRYDHCFVGWWHIKFLWKIQLVVPW